MRGWEDSTSYWRLMERVPGTILWDAQHDLTLEQHRTIGTEIAEYLAEARKFTSTKPEAPDEPRIRDRSSIPREMITKFKESYPIKEGAKYVLSHGDLNPRNILVKDGNVTAIIDWEHGGYRPEWWEWNHPDELTWSWVVTEQMIRLGIDVDVPDDVLACRRMYNKYVREPSSKEVPKYEHEEYDRYLYWHCTNYRRYLNDRDLPADYLAERRKKEVKEEAKRAAIMLTFDKLSPDEQDIFLTGKIQRGVGR
ncbi:uncharacterized protein EAF02_002999 [Botrytis sinoallii]|uniref:uncharacterized protein n=1 Tax=Botrytis sinoallii TaxID=1463999 RepID=UPI0019019464|nr:uncharacterized protein EAF02_002999 [Botrytis sinoallii]KAF7888458.1 hypothetical protein EAF02_002999 [Botrytis sinoallii]